MAFETKHNLVSKEGIQATLESIPQDRLITAFTDMLKLARGNPRRRSQFLLPSGEVVSGELSKYWSPIGTLLRMTDVEIADHQLKPHSTKASDPEEERKRDPVRTALFDFPFTNFLDSMNIISLGDLRPVRNTEYRDDTIDSYSARKLAIAITREPTAYQMETLGRLITSLVQLDPTAVITCEIMHPDVKWPYSSHEYYEINIILAQNGTLYRSNESSFSVVYDLSNLGTEIKHALSTIAHERELAALRRLEIEKKK